MALLCHDHTMPLPVTLTALTGTRCDAASVEDVTTLDAVVVSDVRDLLADLVVSGAALGWIEPPSHDEIDVLLHALTEESENGNASTVPAHEGQRLIAFGCWRRYQRPTHRPHADIPYLAVAPDFHRRGIGGRMLDRLIESARSARIEQLTLDARGDNTAAHELWLSRGFVEYGRITDFVAVGDARYDKTFWVLDLRARLASS
jgi:ribosomal protein S18 acetylase RimI-like enzyme